MFYINTEDSKEAFKRLCNSVYFVDKTGIISVLVPYIGTEQNYFCITRPHCKSLSRTSCALL